MIKEREQQINNIFGVVDVIISVFSYSIAYFVRNLFFEDKLNSPDEYLIIGLLIIPTWFILLKSMNLTEVHRTKSYSKIFVSYAGVVTIGLGVIFLFMFLFKLNHISRFVILTFGVMDFMILFALRITIYRILKYFRTKGFNSRNVVAIADDSSEPFIEKILENKEWGYILKYIVTNSSKLLKKYKDVVGVHPEHVSLRNLIDINVIDEVIYCKNEINQNTLRSFIHDCEEVGVIFRMQSQLFSMPATKAHLNYFDEIPFLTFDNTPSDHFALRIKNSFSVVAAFIILLIWFPAMLFIGII
jgi:FlaA1/EpsC-like NDP-sugar epimerase